MKIVEETSIRYSSSSDNNNNNASSLDIMEALLTAAIDKIIGLDCVYLLLRRQPDLWVELLSSTTPVASAMMTVSKKNSNEDGDGDDDEENDGNSNAIDTLELNSSKKRKGKL